MMRGPKSTNPRSLNSCHHSTQIRVFLLSTLPYGSLPLTVTRKQVRLAELTLSRMLRLCITLGNYFHMRFRHPCKYRSPEPHSEIGITLAKEKRKLNTNTKYQYSKETINSTPLHQVSVRQAAQNVPQQLASR